MQFTYFINFVKKHLYFRLNNAVDLMGLYLNEHPHSATAKMAHDAEMDTRHALLVSLYI
jgi:hypothetical protein